MLSSSITGLKSWGFYTHVPLRASGQISQMWFPAFAGGTLPVGGAPFNTGTTVAFTFHIFSTLPFNPWYFSNLLMFLLLYHRGRYHPSWQWDFQPVGTVGPVQYSSHQYCVLPGVVASTDSVLLYDLHLQCRCLFFDDTSLSLDST